MLSEIDDSKTLMVSLIRKYFDTLEDSWLELSELYSDEMIASLILGRDTF